MLMPEYGASNVIYSVIKVATKYEVYFAKEGRSVVISTVRSSTNEITNSIAKATIGPSFPGTVTIKLIIG